MSQLSAVWPIQVAIAPLLQAISGLGVHQEGEATRTDPLPYAVIGSATEPVDRRAYSQKGLSQTLFIAFLAETKLEAISRYNQGKAALDGQVLTLTGYGKAWRCALGYVKDFREPDTAELKGAHRVVAQLFTETVEA